MKNLFSVLVLLSIFIIAFLSLPDLSMAQSPPPLPSKPAQNPVDGGLIILAAAGGSYAIKKLRDRKE